MSDIQSASLADLIAEREDLKRMINLWICERDFTYHEWEYSDSGWCWGATPGIPLLPKDLLRAFAEAVMCPEVFSRLLF